MVTRHTVVEMRKEKARVLLVEDNVINQKVGIGILKKMGIHVEIAANGYEAVRILEIMDFDIVFMDVQMPEMDGYEATQRIRDSKSNVLNHNIPIIAMTANAMKEDRERCFIAGMNDYISKPVMPEDIEKVIDRWIKKDKGKEIKEEDSGIPVFDREGVMRRVMDDKELFDEIINIYVTEAPENIKNLKECIRKEEFVKVEMQAHGLKGASAHTGAERIRECAARIETAAKEKDKERTEIAFKELEKEFEIFVIESMKK